MEQEIIRSLDPNLECIRYELKKHDVIYKGWITPPKITS